MWPFHILKVWGIRIFDTQKEKKTFCKISRPIVGVYLWTKDFRVIRWVYLYKDHGQMSR